MPCAARSEYTVLEAMSKKVRAFAGVRTYLESGILGVEGPIDKDKDKERGQTAGDGTWPWKKKNGRASQLGDGTTKCYILVHADHTITYSYSVHYKSTTLLLLLPVGPSLTCVAPFLPIVHRLGYYSIHLASYC